MKNYKLPTFPLWISLGVLAILFMPWIDKHSGFFQFLASLILVGVTARYVWLTHEMLKTQELDLKIKTKYHIEPSLQLKNPKSECNVLNILEIEKKISFTVENDSYYHAYDVTVLICLLSPSESKSKKRVIHLAEYNFPVIKANKKIDLLLISPFINGEIKDLISFFKNFNDEFMKKALNYLEQSYKHHVYNMIEIYVFVQYKTVIDSIEAIAKKFSIYCVNKRIRVAISPTEKIDI